MLRHEIIASIEKLTIAIKSSGLAKILDGDFRAGDVAKTVALVAEAAVNFQHHRDRFTDNDRKILAAFSLEALADAGWWIKLITTAPSNDPAVIFGIINGMSTILRYGPRIIALLGREGESHPNDVSYNADYLIVRLTEDQQTSSVERIIEALKGIRELYDVCVAVEQTESNELAVVSCDSGSDKELVLKGTSKAVQKFKGVMIEIWNRVVFYREMQASQRIKNIGDTLPILKEIADLEEKNKISPETAELLRRQVLSAASHLLESGVILPELMDHSTFNPNQLMAPAQKLLASPHSGTSQEDKSEPIEDDVEEAIDNLSSEEIRAMLKRKIKGRRKLRGKPSFKQN